MQTLDFSGPCTGSQDGAGSAAGMGAEKGGSLQQGRRTFLGTVLTGPPGCGKSSIAPFVIAHLARHKKTVLYRHRDMLASQYVLLDFSTSPPYVDIELTTTLTRLAGKFSATWSTAVIWDGRVLHSAPGAFLHQSRMCIMVTTPWFPCCAIRLCCFCCCGGVLQQGTCILDRRGCCGMGHPSKGCQGSSTATGPLLSCRPRMTSTIMSLSRACECHDTRYTYKMLL